MPQPRWYHPPADHARLEHSFVTSLATALEHTLGSIDPVWLMGASGLAFRIDLEETLCPSAISMFDWRAVLPESVENVGHSCVHVSRLWGEDELERQRRHEAHELIVDGLEAGRTAVVWDVADSEWGVVVGWDSETRTYEAIDHRGRNVLLPVDRLGRNGIDVLSVLVPGARNSRSRSEMIRTALLGAVRHAGGGEWAERPRYQNGLAAYDQWALAYERAAFLVGAGKGTMIPSDWPDHAMYHAAHHSSARWHAWRFVRDFGCEVKGVEDAIPVYSDIADLLESVRDDTLAIREWTIEALEHIAALIRQAGHLEQSAHAILRRALDGTG